jgi:hypothetical protein
VSGGEHVVPGEEHEVPLGEYAMSADEHDVSSEGDEVSSERTVSAQLVRPDRSVRETEGALSGQGPPFIAGARSRVAGSLLRIARIPA